MQIAALLSFMEKREIISRITQEEEEKLLLAHVYDLLERTRQRDIPNHTGFLSPKEQQLCMQLLDAMEGPNAQFYGGFDGAERTCLFFLPSYLEEADNSCIRALRVAWYETEELTHRDLLGSLMGLGITREKVGDILVSKQEQTGDIIVTEEILPYLLENFRQAGRVKFQCKEVDIHNLHLPVASCKEIKDTVASLRLDSVLSAAFSISRGKAETYIQSGKVQINWKDEQKRDRMVDQGDCITCRGLGKCEIIQVGNLTKKGRIPVQIKRYT